MPCRRAVLALSLVAGLAALDVGAAELSGDCKPLFAAMEKTLRTNHTTTSIHGATTTRGVTVDGATYIEVRGAWRKAPVSVQQQLDMSRENLKDAKSFTCKALPDSVVDGVPVANYATRTVTEDDTVDTRVSISRATGLAVSVENIIGGDAGASLVTHYGYSGVKAPI